MPSRVALVIGNENYADHPLDNPKNDSLKVGAALTSRGFNVISVVDVDSQTMAEALTKFYRDAEGAEICVLFFAGHAIEVGGLGYLIPVDVEIKLGPILYRAIPIHEVIEGLSAIEAPKILIVDACRKNVVEFTNMEWAKFAEVLEDFKKNAFNTRELLIAYSTSSGDVAGDGTGMNNSLFSDRLSYYVTRHGLNVEDVFKKTGMDVIGQSSTAQRPWYYSNLGSDVKFSDLNEYKVIHSQLFGGGRRHENPPTLSGHESCFEALVSPGNQKVGLASVSCFYHGSDMPAAVIAVAMAGSNLHAVLDSGGNFRLWISPGASTLWENAIDNPRGVKFSPCGERLAVYGAKRAVVFDLKSSEFRVLADFKLPYDPFCAVFTNGSEFLLSGENGRLSRITLSTSAEFEEIDLSDSDVGGAHAYSMALIPSQSEVAITYCNGRVVLFDTAKLRQNRVFNLNKKVQSPIVQRDALADSVQGEMITNFIFHPSRLSKEDFEFCQSKLSGNELMCSSAAMPSDLLAVGSSDGYLYLLDVRDGQLAQRVDVGADRGKAIEAVQITRGGLIAVLTADCYIYHYASGTIPVASEKSGWPRESYGEIGRDNYF